jgi:ubiquinone/menaquinone biosynthesis C-methylase UbiE
MTEREEFYRGEDVSAEELERLRTIEYPSYVSEVLLNDIELREKRLLDVGAGTNASLGKYVTERHGSYVPLDVRDDMLRQLHEDLGGASFLGVRGSVEQLPFAHASVDVVHQRFVLMNLRPEARGAAVQEILRVAKEKALFLEYDWGTLASDTSPDVVGRFRELALRFFERTYTDACFGGKLEDVLRANGAADELAIRHFRREESEENVPELIQNCCSFAAGAKNMLKDET